MAALPEPSPQYLTARAAEGGNLPEGWFRPLSSLERQTTPEAAIAHPTALRDAAGNPIPGTEVPASSTPAAIETPFGLQPGYIPSSLMVGMARTGIGALMGAPVGATLAPPGEKGRGAVAGAFIGAAVLGPGGEAAMRAQARSLTRAAETALRDPAVMAVDRTIDHTGSLARRIRRAANPIDWERAYQQVANDLYPLERPGFEATEAGRLRPSQNPAYVVQRFKASDETVRRAVYHGIPDPLDVRATVGPSYEWMVEPLGRDPAMVRAADDFIKATRDLGRGGARGTPEYLASLPDAVNRLGQVPELQEFIRRADQYVNGLRSYALRSGLWNPRQVDALVNSDAIWMPYKRIIGDVFGVPYGGLRSSGRLANVTPGILRFKGGTEPIESPLRSLLEYTDLIIRRADRYRVGAAVFDFHRAVPEMELLTPFEKPKLAAPTATAPLMLEPEAAEALGDLRVEIESPHNPEIWRNVQTGVDEAGQPVWGREYARVNYPRYWQALLNLRPNDITAFGRLLNVTLGTARTIFTATTTGLNPRFGMAYNPIRDVMQASGQMPAQPTGVLGGITGWLSGYGGAINQAVGGGTPATSALEAGLGGASYFEHPIGVGAVARRLIPSGRAQKGLAAVARIIGRPITALERMGTISDRGPRYATAESAMRSVQGRVDRREWTPEDQWLYGIAAGRTSTIDFWNKPGARSLAWLRKYVPFLGPALQGPFRTLDAIRTNPRGVIEYGALASLFGVLEWTLHNRNDAVRTRVDDRDPNERASFALLPFGSTGGMMVRVPMQQDINVVRALTLAGLEHFADENPDAARVFGQSVLRMMPPGVSESLELGMPVPPIPGVLQVAENAVNRRSFGGAPVVPESMMRLPPELRRRETTARTFDVLASALRVLPGMDQLSPLQVENVARGIFSAATPMITGVLEPLAAQIAGEQAVHIPSRMNLSVTGLVARQPAGRTAAEGRYYRMRSKIEQASGAYREALERGDPDAIRRSERLADLMADVRWIDREVAGYRDEYDAVVELAGRNRITPQDARWRIDRLTLERQRFMRAEEVRLRRDFERATKHTPSRSRR